MLLSLFAAALPLALAAPSDLQVVEKRAATTLCGQWDSLVEGQYTFFTDGWGWSGATSGSQCLTFNSISGTTVSWSTNWTWAGGSSQVKSYAQAQYNPGVVLSSVTSIPTVWDWTYTGSNIVADVAYDCWLGPAATGTQTYEIMIWLAALGGAGPISNSGSTPIASPSIGGVTWNLFTGSNGAQTVFSFVAASQQSNFSGDLLPFFTYLVQHEGVSSSQYLQTIDCGTEPFTGTGAVLNTSKYSVSVSSSGGGGGSPTTTHTTTTTPTTTGSAPGATQSHYGQCGGQGYTGPTVCASPYTCTVSNQYYSQCL